MSICPKCHKIITELDQVRTGIEKARFFIDKDGCYDYDDEEFDSDGDFLEFRCWECNEVLFKDYEEAEEFLKDKDELQEIVAEKLNKIKEENKK